MVEKIAAVVMKRTEAPGPLNTVLQQIQPKIIIAEMEMKKVTKKVTVAEA